jgi:hypothetical protein
MDVPFRLELVGECFSEAFNGPLGCAVSREEGNASARVSSLDIVEGERSSPSLTADGCDLLNHAPGRGLLAHAF